ncbi:MAG TPA: hypothetical protein VEA99_13695 [Gemmatimonadaceae bacterium]|nr:hypothetical protein [Gemmatimonadaceae bacterium]
MTRAPDSIVLPPAAIERLRQLWIETARADAQRLTRERLRLDARVIAAQAHAVAMAPAQLLEVVTESWRAHVASRPEARHAPEWMLTEIAALCICEYHRAVAERAA